MDAHLNKISIHYLFSKNRSGSTLLNNLLNNHPNIVAIPEENVYWLLKKEHGHIQHFTQKQLRLFLDDFYFLITKSEHKFSEFIFPTKEELYTLLIQAKIDLTYLNVTTLIYLNSIYGLTKNRDAVSHIINKEIQFNHLISPIQKEFPASKFILLIRDPRANIYSTYKTQPNRKNFCYHAKKWVLENAPLLPHLHAKNALFIKYEAFVSHPQETMDLLFTFLEIDKKPIDAQKTDFINSPRVHEFIQQRSIPSSKIALFKQNHLGSLSKIEASKIDEWKSKNVFTPKELEKINFICSNLATQYGYTIPLKKVPFHFTDYFYMLLARIDYYIACKYVLMPVQLKRFLRAINFLRFYQ